jgi:hypothetical protein
LDAEQIAPTKKEPNPMNQTETNTKRNLNEIDNDDTRNFAINLSEDLKTEGLWREDQDLFDLQDLIHERLNAFLNERFNANIKE